MRLNLIRGSIILIIYGYHVLINALSAHMIHINLHMIFYTLYTIVSLMSAWIW